MRRQMFCWKRGGSAGATRASRSHADSFGSSVFIFIEPAAGELFLPGAPV
jgi:hypothetical protein